jgi:hypothetical protein
VLQLDQSGNYFASVCPVGKQVSSVDIRAGGEMVCAGEVGGTCDFNPGPGVNSYTAQCPTPFGDFFIAKYTSSGGFVWFHAAGNASAEGGGGPVRFDNFGNMYLAGSCASPVDLQPGPGTVYNNTSGSFLAKYTSAGTLAWSRNGATGFDLDNLDNLYLCSAGTLQCLNPAGQVYWSMSSTACGFNVAVSPDGHIYFGDHGYGLFDVDPGSGVINANCNTSGSSYFVLCLNHIYAGTSENTTLSSSGLYPNPAGDFITITENTSEAGEFVIFNSLGQEVLRQNSTGAETRIDVSSLAPGIYFLQCEADNSVQQFVISRN